MQLVVSYIFLLTSLVASADQVPCWFTQPANEQQIGFIGAASAFSISANGSLIRSREKALARLKSYLNLQAEIDKQDLLQAQIELHGHQVHFSEAFIHQGTMFSYAWLVTNSDGQNTSWITQMCPRQRCEFNQCKPDWLCDSSSNDIIGVSQITATPSMQLQKTWQNADLIASFLRKTAVSEEVKRVESSGEFQNWGRTDISRQIESVTTSATLLNTHLCEGETYLFGLFKANFIEHQTDKSFNEWKFEPGFGERAGVVGAFQGIPADGLFSSAIEYAIKDGLLQLAKVKEVNINHEYRLKYQDGWYSLTKSTESTSATVSGILMDLKVVEEDDQLVIYAWLIEN